MDRAVGDLAVVHRARLCSEAIANPGRSQSGGTTSQDRAIQRQDNKIDKSICKGC